MPRRVPQFCWPIRVVLCALLVGALLLPLARAQQPETTRPAPLAPLARLQAARTICLEHSGASIPNDVIGEAFAGWGRYNILFEREKADLLVTIAAPTSDSGVSVASSTGEVTSRRDVSSAAITLIRLTVRDAHDGAVLWTGSEVPKGAIKTRQRQDNEVEASLRLFRRFRLLIEPEPVQ